MANTGAKVDLDLCMFLNNSVTQHDSIGPKGLLVSDGGYITITNCQYIGNIFTEKTSRLFSVQNGEISVIGSSFSHNKVGDLFMFIQSTNHINFTRNNFIKNDLYRTLLVVSKDRLRNRYLLVDSCNFQDYFTVIITIENITDIILRNTTFLTVVAYPSCYIQNAQSVHIWNSLFNGVVHPERLYLGRNSSFTSVLQMFTHRSGFNEDNYTLWSNEANFLQRAISKKFINKEYFLNLVTKESEYASGKFTSHRLNIWTTVFL